MTVFKLQLRNNLLHLDLQGLSLSPSLKRESLDIFGAESESKTQ